MKNLLQISKRNSAFALVATIMLMVLLAIIVLGSVTLSTVTLRNGGRDQSIALAKSNARMALMLAIGELQKNAGPDTRITARADILDASNPMITGVWRSWEGSNHDATGRPIQPDYASKLKTEASSNERFLTWLISGATAADDSADLIDPKSLVGQSPFTKSSSPWDQSIPLLATGSLSADDTRQIHVVPQRVNAEDSALYPGTHAWWVSGENQKARLPKPFVPDDQTAAAGWADMRKSHGVADPSVFGLESLLQDPSKFTPDPANPKNVEKVVSLLTADLLNPDADVMPRNHFHDLSVTSLGLQTNAATGGWKKDLSILSENWDAITANSSSGLGLPMFRYDPTPGRVSSSIVPTPAAPLGTVALFPWTNVQGGSNARKAPIRSWRHLVSHLTAYKQVTGTDGNYSMPLSYGLVDTNRDATEPQEYKFIHQLDNLPVLARVQWVFSWRAVQVTAPSAPNPGTYRMELLVSPAVTLWNPYNVGVRITNPQWDLEATRNLPVALGFYDDTGPGNALQRQSFRGLIRGPVSTPNGSGGFTGIHMNYQTSTYTETSATNRRRNYRWLSGVLFANGNISSMGMRFPATSFTLGPGQTQLYSLNSQQLISNDPITLTPGYNPSGGFFYNKLIGTGQNATADLNLRGDVNARLDLRFDANMCIGTTATYESAVGVSMSWYDLNRPPSGPGSSDNQNRARVYTARYRDSDYKPEDRFSEIANTFWPEIAVEPVPVASLTGGWQPFLIANWGPRIANATTMPGKGVLQGSPWVVADDTNTGSGANYVGTQHPLNSPYEFEYVTGNVIGMNLPNVGPGNSTYIGTGSMSGTGLARLILSELPLRPVRSLGELQHWDARGANPAPPYQIYVVGNSDASPLFPANGTFINARQYDSSYCANHVLFDDVFFSSIAPEINGFGSSGIKRTSKEVLGDFLNPQVATPLGNKSYLPIAGDRGLNDAARTDLVNDLLESSDGWMRSASHLEVEGMFNVNSTSVTAWKALLRHCKNQKIPYYNNRAATTMALSDDKDYLLSRFSVATDPEAGKGSATSGGMEVTDELTGYRVFTEEMIDLLAEKVVDQVRLRGPFLSLSEFVNRQLSSGDLALAGALQTALNQVTEEKDTYDTLKAAGILSDLNDPRIKDLENYLGYQFKDAAKDGYSTYGWPGWIRQADILTPIAPILSVRDDTFTIRAYGDARDKNGKVISSVWCEATVQRTRDFINEADPADSVDTPVQAENQKFGRSFEIRAFRWLSPNEV